MCSCTYKCLSPDKASPSYLLAILQDGLMASVYCYCMRLSNHSALWGLVLSPANSFLHYVVCTEHHNSICIVSKCNNKILTLLVFSEPKLRDQPPKSLYYLPTVDTTQPLCSQPTLLQNRISPRYSCRANTRGLPRGKSTGSTYDTTAQPSCVLTHKAYNLAIAIDSAYFLLHPVCSSWVIC